MKKHGWLNRLGIALVIAGAVVCLAAWQGNGQKWSFITGENVGFRKVSLALDSSDITSLTVQESNGAVCLEKSPDSQFHVSCHETEKEQLKWTEDEKGNLVIRRIREFEWYDHISIFPWVPECTMVISIPDGYSGPVVIETENGDILAEEQRMTGSLSLETSNGRIIVSNQALKELTAKSSNGLVELNDVVCEDVICAETSNGGISLQRVQCSSKIHIVTSNADIILDRVQCPDVQMESSNGNITGTMLGEAVDYAISTRTTNGKIRVPEGAEAGKGTLEIRTSNGDIVIEFVE